MNDFMPEEKFRIETNELIQLLTLTKLSKAILELETINQADSQQWFNERR